MAAGDDKYEGIAKVLTEHGFHVEQYQADSEPSQALYLKTRSGPSIAVTVPLDCSAIPDVAIRQIMETARVPEPEYRHLLKST